MSEVIRLSGDGGEAEVAPGRGGMVTRFSVDGSPVLYLDQSTLENPSQNVRGGIPILFPTAGRLANDRYGERVMKQHGFARNLPWRVLDRTASMARIALDSTDETLAAFPFPFRVEYTYVVDKSALHIGQVYRNLGAAPMPLHAGFHPYFLIADADKQRAQIATPARRAFDNVTRQEVAFNGFDLTQKEVDMHLLDHGSSRATLTRPDGRTVELAGSPEYTHWVVWTLAGKDFVCLEPWTAPGNALNTGERLILIPPGNSHSLELSIALR